MQSAQGDVYFVDYGLQKDLVLKHVSLSITSLAHSYLISLINDFSMMPITCIPTKEKWKFSKKFIAKETTYQVSTQLNKSVCITVTYKSPFVSRLPQTDIVQKDPNFGWTTHNCKFA